MFACMPREPLDEVHPVERIIEDGVPEVGAFPEESQNITGREYLLTLRSEETEMFPLGNKAYTLAGLC